MGGAFFNLWGPGRVEHLGAKSAPGGPRRYNQENPGASPMRLTCPAKASRLRSAASALLTVFVMLPGAAPAAEKPLDSAGILRLHAVGMPESTVKELVTRLGMQGPLGVEEIETLREAGVSAELVAYLVSALPRQSPVDGVNYLDRDGVLVVEGHGEAAADEALAGAPDAATPDAPTRAPALSAPPVLPPPVTIVIASQPAPASQALAARQDSGAYPVGAEYGWTGSAVFLPARFGGSPSSFGRAIVSAPSVVQAVVPACGMGGLGLDGVVAELASRSNANLIPLRTSRGTIWVPN